jgi:pimeloyl-ACP methyl ester carboxylesterase
MQDSNAMSSGRIGTAVATPTDADGEGASRLLRGGALTRDGCRLVHLVQGRGPVLVFAHGGLARGSSWLPTTDLLHDRFTCVMVDQRAHGASDWGGGPDIDRAADDLLAVVDQHRPAHGVVGHSYGALVALEAARRAPAGLVPRLVLYEPALAVGGPIMEADTLRAVDAAVERGDYEQALLLHLSSAAGGLPPAQVEAFRSNPMLRGVYADLVIQAPSIPPGIRAANALDVAERYAGVDVPTVVLLGSDSPRHPFRTAAEALAAVMPDTRIEVLAGQAHLATLLAPNLVADAIAAAVPSP